jgi:zinc protease
MTPTFANRTTYARLDSGLDVYLLPTSLADAVMATVVFPGGRNATYERQTLALLLGELLPGGTKRRPRTKLRERLESLGADVSVDVRDEHLVLSLACRKQVFEEAFRLVIEALCAPVIRPAEFREAVTHLDTAMHHLAEDTRAQANLAVMNALYPKGHPHWASSPSALRAELRTVTSADMLAFHRETFSTVGAVACVVGDLTPTKLLRVMDTALAAVPTARPSRIPALTLTRSLRTRTRDLVVSLSDKMNIDTTLAIPLALTRDHTDYLALTVGVQVLGGSGSARLFQVLRNQKSLTYGAYALVAGTEDGYPGYLAASAIFPNTSFLEGRTALRVVVQMWAEKGITTTEHAKRTEEIVGKYQVGLATSRGVARMLLGAVLTGKPVSYLDEYPQLIAALRLRDINAAIREHVDYGLAVTAAAGAIDAHGKPRSS